MAHLLASLSFFVLFSNRLALPCSVALPLSDLSFGAPFSESPRSLSPDLMIASRVAYLVRDSLRLSLSLSAWWFRKGGCAFHACQPY